MSLFAETVKIRREELGLGQEELAAALGTTQQTVSRWERGVALPRPKRVVALATLLELDPTQLHRFAGYLPEDEPSSVSGPWQGLCEHLPRLTGQELMLLMDKVREELRRREGFMTPGPT